MDVSGRLCCLVGETRIGSHICVLGSLGSTRFASWLNFAPRGFVNFRPLPLEGGASVEWLYPSMRISEQQMTKICC